MLNSNFGKILILIITFILYSVSSFIVQNKNNEIKEKLIEEITLNEKLKKEFDELKSTFKENHEQLNKLNQENVNLKNQLNNY